MKRIMTLAAMFAAIAISFSACTPEDNPGPEDDKNGQENVTPDDKPNEENNSENSGNTGTTTPTDNLAPEVKDGDNILVTNADVEKFLTDVHYEDNDYSHTDLLTWAETNGVQVCPGKDTYKPQSYTIRWEADAAAGDVAVTLTEGEWSREYTVKAGGSYVEITNLVPNAHYRFEAKAGDKVLTSGEFSTYGKVRQLFIKTNIRNCRDLGGWATADGKTVRYRMIYRGGRLDPGDLAESGKDHFKAENIKAQLDLRYEEDVLQEGESPLKELFEDYEFCAPLFKQGYTYLLKEGEKTRQTMKFIMDCVDNNKPVYFHCSLGRDRTGTVAMLVLGILGVPEGDISQEYELTQFAPFSWATSTGEKTKMTRLADYDGAAKYIWDGYVAEGETFADGVEKYLLQIGISQADIDKFRSNMLVDVPVAE